MEWKAPFHGRKVSFHGPEVPGHGREVPFLRLEVPFPGRKRSIPRNGRPPAMAGSSNLRF